MILPDVNILIYAHREDTDAHKDISAWFYNVLHGDSTFALSELILSSFLRIVTHSRVFKTPTPYNKAIMYVEQLKNHPNCLIVTPGNRHWDIFIKLCQNYKLKGNLIPDAYLAALAIEHACEWASTDRGFRRFKELKLIHPLDS